MDSKYGDAEGNDLFVGYDYLGSNAIAYARFAYTGVVAIVPMGKRFQRPPLLPKCKHFVKGALYSKYPNA